MARRILRRRSWKLFDNLALGFSVAFSLQNLLYCFIGCLLGSLIGVLPGLGPVATIAMLLPITFGLPPVSALIMLAASIMARSMVVPPRPSSSTCRANHPPW